MGHAESKTCGVDPLLFTLCPETMCHLIRVGSASTEPFLEPHAVTPEQRAAHSRRRFSSPGLTATEYAPAADGNATEYAQLRMLMLLITPPSVRRKLLLAAAAPAPAPSGSQPQPQQHSTTVLGYPLHPDEKLHAAKRWR